MNRDHQSLSLKLLFLLTVTAAVFLLYSTRVAAQTPPLPPSFHRVVPGDTLWEIASDLETGRDPRAVISEIRVLNGLESVDIRPGQVLLLPTSGG
ncbi:MAG TPA: LysM peptidoglycan-binding domain-containing protein [Acidimicrobiia bacterium]|nr:LysM peptidoglycan-binding domain-containing protein [Acidimicrobiia bacterium]